MYDKWLPGFRIYLYFWHAHILFVIDVHVSSIHADTIVQPSQLGHRFVLVFGLGLSERILKESSSPGVEVLVFPLVVGIREICTGSSPAVEPGRR